MPLTLDQIVQQPERIVADFTVRESNELFYNPCFSYALDMMSPFIKLKRNVTNLGWKLTYLEEDDVAIQPNNDISWNPIGLASFKQRMLKTAPFKIQSEIARDEFWDSCLEFWGGVEVDRGNLNATETGRQILGAYANVKMKAVKKNIVECALFGKESLAFADLANGTPVNSKMSAATYRQRVHAMLTQMNGWFYDIHTADGGSMIVTNSLQAHNESALPAGFANDLFKAMKYTNDGRLLEYVMANHGFIVSHTVYRNYYEYLIATYSAVPEALRMKINGVDVLTWEGIPVIPLPSWDFAQKRFFNKTNRHFAVLTIYENFALGTDIAATDGTPRLIIEQGKEVPNRKKIYMDGEFKMAAKIAIPDFCNAAFSYDMGA